ncbi:MAG: AsmA family protein [Verrucomicrobiota bacterium]|nr:AsmA family protein [Verrucomicrobiota bacterium]
MKTAGRILLIILSGVAVLAVVILLAVNLYVQSQGTQARIQQELSQRLGTTLRLQRMSVTPWGGLKLSGITIPQAKGGPTTQFLEAKTFRLRVEFRSLFSGRLVIKEILFVDPKVVWLQNADGKWRIPPPTDIAPGRPSAAVEKKGVVSTAASSPVAQASVEPLATATRPPTPRSAESRTAEAITSPSPTEAERQDAPFTPELRRVNLTGGHFRFLDANTHPVATFDDVQFHSNFRNAAAVKGNIQIAKTSLRDRFFLQQLQSRLEYGAGLDLSDITARAGGGEITGGFTMQPESEDSPFTAKVRFRDVQADRIVAEAGGPAGVITGKLEGFLDAAGKTADPNALSGTGEIHLRDGEVRRYSVLEALGEILQIDELRQLKLNDAHVKYHITPGVVIIDELLLQSANVRLSATGTIGFDGRLQLPAQLAVNEKIRKQLFRAIRDNFQPIAESGFAAVNFEIGGTVERPHSNLMDKVVGRDLKDIGSVINSLFGGVSERKTKKNKAPEDAKKRDSQPSPTPSPDVIASPTEPAEPTASP